VGVLAIWMMVYPLFAIVIACRHGFRWPTALVLLSIVLTWVQWWAILPMC